MRGRTVGSEIVLSAWHAARSVLLAGSVTPGLCIPSGSRVVDATIKQRYATCAACGYFLIMGTNEKRRPVLAIDLAHECQNLIGRGPVETAGWLICQNEFRAIHQGPGN